jgi:hypothetical protein
VGARAHQGVVAARIAAWINGRRIAEPELLDEHDRIYIGAFVLQLEQVDARIAPIYRFCLACGGRLAGAR